MTRRQVIGFVVVFALIAAGLVARQLGSKEPSRLPELRRAAALQPCPAGLGPDLPQVTLPCLGGGAPVALRSAGVGRPTLVNIWGSWCGPCVAEVPDLVRFTEKAGSRVAVVGIDTEDDPVSALTFAAKHGMRYPSLVDDDKHVLRAFGSGPPVTLFVDASGRVAYTHQGQFHSLAEIEALVAQHLGVRL
jgi:cytochrome c biogenesis protein CcmG/thiol:disulfide interchange protein DsbE